MKKYTLSAGVLSAMLLLSPITGGNTVEASTQYSSQVLMWGENELTRTQLGRIVFTKAVKVYKRDANNVAQFHLNAKKGSLWRVHKITKEGGKNIYDLGGGVRVQQTDLSKFERPPVELIKKQVEYYGAIIDWKGMGINDWGTQYPQVSRLESKAVENKINNKIYSMAINLQDGNGGVETTIYNQSFSGKFYELVVIYTQTGYTENKGIPFKDTYTEFYNLTTGEVVYSDSTHTKGN